MSCSLLFLSRSSMTRRLGGAGVSGDNGGLLTLNEARRDRRAAVDILSRQPKRRDGWAIVVLFIKRQLWWGKHECGVDWPYYAEFGGSSTDILNNLLAGAYYFFRSLSSIFPSLLEVYHTRVLVRGRSFLSVSDVIQKDYITENRRMSILGRRAEKVYLLH